MKKIAICIFLCLMTGLHAFAQQVKLTDISKIELISSSPFWVGASLHVVEVLPEGKVWNSYQRARYFNYPKPIRDSVRRFLKVVPEKDIKQLLVYINHPDTAIKLKQFKIQAKALVGLIDTLKEFARSSLKTRHDKSDSLTANLTARQKAYYIKMTTSKQAVNDATLKALRPLFNDDRSYYNMIFTYKDKHKDTVSAYVNDSHLYHLPWQIKNKNNYNPHLSELFETILGEEDFAKHEMDRLVFNIAFELNGRWVLTEALWEDYKTHYPFNYKNLSKTLEPAYFYSSRSGYFKSSLLPFNLQLRFSFTLGDTLKTKLYNAVEEQMVNSYKKGNFFFDYLKHHSTSIAFVNSISQKTVEGVKAIYPSITKYNYHDIKFISVLFDYYRAWDSKKNSGWLLLPDGKMILLFCSDVLIQEGDKIFAGLKPAGWNKHRNYCIVYDNKGNKITGGEIPVKIDLN
ncbi:hypothetical protein ACFS5N_17690 [Mucilaginibacter ximonensis]|uniref:Uncharacterized protein n=1 Tax=Mucilaginibacter ximonensis TaxID=538021 RepID=A0ABW5YG09_9SPHI